MTMQADTARREAIYRRLEARNRLIAILRIGVPALGLVALTILVGQIYLSSLGSRFGIGQITVTRDSVTADAPEYAGLLDDGTAYHVSAVSAQAATDATDKIAMRDARLTMTRTDGEITNIAADAAVLDTTTQSVLIEKQAEIATSEGTRGVVANSVFDYATQTLMADGDVEIDYADGTHLVAEGMTYDAVSLVWTFTRATVTLQDTPGAGDDMPQPGPTGTQSP